jgi:uncharacterized protein (TIGR03790 family)
MSFYRVAIGFIVLTYFCFSAFYIFRGEPGLKSASSPGKSNPKPQSFSPVSEITTKNLAIIVNEADPLSVQIADYYQQRRGIPAANRITVKFPSDRTTLSPEEFAELKTEVDRKTPANIQAYALTWAKPDRVDCMSITTAFAAGFDLGYCIPNCGPTIVNPYFDSFSTTPYQDFHLRPTIAIAATNFSEAKKLIDRGIAADGTFPSGTAYLLSTTDETRNVRSRFYLQAFMTLQESFFKGKVIEADNLVHKSDVMFYFTGQTFVADLATNRFLPGAIADHLTSLGGQLTDSSQMSSLRWLEAGATGSYGTVTEPCNFTQKFPNPEVVMYYYLHGETLLEAYWKSVQWPGQGIFIGEPLARPFGVTP